MSDNMRYPPLELGVHPRPQLGVLGFSDDPGEPSEHGLVGDGSTAIHQRWFALGANQIHPAASVSGFSSGPDLHSNLDSDHDRQPNIRFLTVVVRVGSRTFYHTEKLDAAMSAEDMDRGVFATILNGINNIFTKQQLSSSSWDGVAKIVKECTSLPDGSQVIFAASDGSTLLSASGSPGRTQEGTDNGYRAFSRAVDHSQTVACFRLILAVIVLIVVYIAWLTMSGNASMSG